MTILAAASGQGEEPRPASPHAAPEEHEPPLHDQLPKSSDGSSGEAYDKENGIQPLRRTTTQGHQIGKLLFLRTDDNDDDQDWWFASTAIPLLAATIGPLANVCSVAALVTSWRLDVYDPATDTIRAPLDGIPFDDPKWCYDLNVISLIFGFVGNLFLLLNFTHRIRYIIALPVTIIFWYVATAFLMGITIHMNLYAPPIHPKETYSQGFWYAVISACLYMVCSMLLMVNMLGYFLGHYPQHFNLTDSQRTLILQTMLFFIWLAGGGFMFARIETTYGHDPPRTWSFVNSLYFCDVTILTVGFGDLYPTDDIGRGVVFPYSVVGIIMLGLTISSISKFAAEIGAQNVIKSHVEKQRIKTLNRTTEASTQEVGRTRNSPPQFDDISSPTDARPFRRLTWAPDEKDQEEDSEAINVAPDSPPKNNASISLGLRRVGTGLKRAGTIVTNMTPNTKTKTLLLHEEKDRFEAMRRIQTSTDKFKRYASLCGSVTAFGLLWCVGAVVFWQCEKNVQDMKYFEALYFGYVSLLTIGYGDLAPKSNAGRPFFVVWSLLAVPTMTILISHMGDTIISSFNKGTNSLADFTVLPQAGAWRNFLERHPWLLLRIKERMEKRAAKKRLEEGFQTGPDPDLEDAVLPIPTIEELAEESDADMHDLAKKLALAIRQTAHDLKVDHDKLYSYEEWVEFTQLIRFTKHPEHYRPTLEEEEEDGMIEWDWIGENSPMMTEQTEPEFVLDRLTESMGRYIRHNDPGAQNKADNRRASETVGRRSSVLEAGDDVEDDDDPLSRVRRFRTNSSEQVSRRRSLFPDRRKSSFGTVRSGRRFSSMGADLEAIARKTSNSINEDDGAALAPGANMRNVLYVNFAGSGNEHSVLMNIGVSI